jgi:hypothetical protein
MSTTVLENAQKQLEWLREREPDADWRLVTKTDCPDLDHAAYEYILLSDACPPKAS